MSGAIASAPGALFAIVAATAAASLVGTWGVLNWLRRRGIFDHPNERSSHAAPTPRGGGWAVMATIFCAWAAIALFDSTVQRPWIALAAAAMVAILSWIDDLRGLPAALRLGVQAGAIAIGLGTLPADALVFQGALPLALDRAAAGLAWLWFVNLFNFMDGIDGIAATETAALGAGLVVVAAVGAGGGGMAGGAAFGAALAGAALGFLRWNWHRARIFLGDVGSVSLGFLLGWLLANTAAAGAWLPALVLPAYYLADATITLLRRLMRGARVWQGHREHFYQRAVQGGWSHAAVVRRIAAADLALIALAGASAALGPWPALLGTALVVGVLLATLARMARAGAK